MLELRHNRLDYTGELLRPPDGYRFERAVATTYSLDLETLMAVLLPLAYGSASDTPGLPACEPLLLQALNRVASRLTVFHQVGQIPVPKHDSPLYALLDRILVPVVPKRICGAVPSFHPKTWTIEYRNDEGDVRYRFVVLSRNLTFDRSLDVAIALESGPDRRKTRATRPLCDFLSWLARQTDKDLPHAQEHVRRAEAMAKGLLAHPLALDENKTWHDFEILPLYGNGAPDDPLFADAAPLWKECPDRLVAISPFLSDSVLERMVARVRNEGSGPDITLATRSEAWASLRQETREGIAAWALKDQVAAPEPPPGGDEANNSGAESPREADLHAKLYLWQRPRETRLLLGSMNATESGLHRNIELLVRLRGNPRSYGYETLCKDLFGHKPEDAANPFERLRDDATQLPGDAAEEAAKRDLQEIVQSFCRCGAKGQVACEDGNRALVVKIPAEFSPPSCITCTLRPMALEVAAALPLRGTLHFGGLRETDLSPLFVLSAKKAGCQIERIVRVPVEGIDETMRNAAIAQSAIDSGGGWANALALLFSDEPYYTASEQARRLAEGGGNAIGSHLPPGLYEQMLRAIAAPDGRTQFSEAESLLARYGGEEAQCVKDLLGVFRKALGRDGGGQTP